MSQVSQETNASMADRLQEKIQEIELRVRAQEEFIRALSDEEIELLKSFRLFKAALMRDGQVFKWQTRREEK